MLRIFWKAVSLNVIAGATVILSPVCTPIGSKFSTVQIITTLSFLSRKSSNSNSFQPSNAFSTSTSCIGLAFKPLSSAASSSSLCITIPPPVPPSVNEGRITNGIPISCANSFPSSNELATRLGATPIPISIINWRNFSRSSAVSIAFTSTPIIFTLYLSQTPSSSASLQRFNAVCPPMVGNTASSCGFSSRISSILSIVRGNKYTLSAIIGSVIMVAGLLLMRITSIPSSRKLRAACEPE